MFSRATRTAEDEPTPDPSSAVVPAAATSLDELPVELRTDPFVAYLLRMTPEEDAHLAARSEAAAKGRELYGDERSDAWLAALEDGTHPLCRLSDPMRP